uniref:VOC family protein n=1 Tax=Stappia sp. TaxID=1870903 RepID=UPI003BA8943B
MSVSSEPKNAAAFNMDAAPMRVGRVGLRVRDLSATARFYRDVIGLQELERSAGRVVLGAGAVPLVELDGQPDLAPVSAREAGLFHTAFLLPTRGDLGRWLSHAAGLGARIEGASDHIVSEAVYLSDPEGNGIEVYADRPEADWRTPDGTVTMSTDPMDVEGVLAAGEGAIWEGMPEGGRVGHVHLRVGETGASEGFYRDVLGFDISAHYPGASFFGSGGYHHQLAGNVWGSRGAGARDPNRAGLDFVEILARDSGHVSSVRERAGDAGVALKEAGQGGVSLGDPWGTRIHLRAA